MRLLELSLTITALTTFALAQKDGDYSPPKYPSPWMRGGNGWADAYIKAQAFVSQLTLLEKVNLTTGVGWEGLSCVGNTGSVDRIGFAGLCLQDSPTGIRFSMLFGLVTCN
jgi:beta-glucosidase